MPTSRPLSPVQIIPYGIFAGIHKSLWDEARASLPLSLRREVHAFGTYSKKGTAAMSEAIAAIVCPSAQAIMDAEDAAEDAAN